jgi:hypothetical protein
MTAQPLERILPEDRRDQPIPMLEPAHEVSHQLGDVIGTLTQRREVDRDHMQPIIQVLPEAPGGDLRPEIAVRRRDHPHIHPDRELANICERLAILHPGRRLGAGEVAGVLPGAARESRPGGGASGAEGVEAGLSLTERLDALERRLIERAIDEAAGNLADAARELRTDRPNLYRRMRRLGIER